MQKNNVTHGFYYYWKRRFSIIDFKKAEAIKQSNSPNFIADKPCLMDLKSENQRLKIMIADLHLKMAR